MTVILALSVTYTITTVAGGTYAGDGRRATAAQIGSAEGLAADAAGNLYIADALDHRIRKVAPDGRISTIAGDGHRGFKGDGGPAAEAQLDSPYGLLLDGAGNLYVADLGNRRIRRIAPDGTITTVAGGGSVPAPEAGDALSARFGQPRNVALDAAGNLYISDFGEHRVYRVTRDGRIFRFAGTGQRASAPAQGPALEMPLDSPAGLAVDRSGRVYIADAGHSAIRVVANGRMTTLAIAGQRAVSPLALAFDPHGVLYIADGAGYLIAAGTPSTPPPELFGAHSLCFGPGGTLYIAVLAPSANRLAGVVYRATRGGEVAAVAGDGRFRPPDDGIPAVFSHLAAPAGVAIDDRGTLYISDRWNDRIRKVSRGAISTLAAVGHPAGLAVAADGEVWVASSSGHSILRIGSDGVRRAAGKGQAGYTGDSGPPADAGFSFPESVAFDHRGNAYVADSANHVIRRFGTEVIRTFAGKGVRGYAGDGGPALLALLAEPQRAVVDGSGNVLIADTGNSVIRRVDPEGLIATLAAGPLNSPRGLALDAEGNLFIADTYNHRIQRVAPDGTIATIAGTGAPGFGGDGGPAIEAQLNGPVDVAVDASGNVYIADSGNNCIRKLTPVSAPVTALAPEVFSVANAASMVAGAVAPGELLTLFGNALGPGVAVEGGLAVRAGGVQVRFDGRPAPLLYVQWGQINLQAPYSIAGRATTEVEILDGDTVAVRLAVPVAPAAPAIFAAPDGQAVAINQDGSTNRPSNPAPRGTILLFYATGEGQTEPDGVEGTLAAAPYPRPVLPVAVRIGGLVADVLYAGAAPGFAGLMQCNVRVSAALEPGVHALELLVGEARSQPGVTVAVQ